MAAVVQALDVVFEVRTPGDATADPVVAPGAWKELVCAVDDQSELDNEVSEVDTKCGTFSGVKNVKGAYSGNAAANAVPTGTEVSALDVAQYQDNKTLLDARYYNKENGDIPEGSVINEQFKGRFTNSVKTSAVGEVVQFSWTFTPDGPINIGDPIV